MPKTLNVYDEITQAIIAELEAGRAPWVQPWCPKAAAKFSGKVSENGVAWPYNAATGRPYSGINVILLWMFGPPGLPAYMTLKQANKLGGRVKKGSTGFRIVYANSHVKTETRADGSTEVVSAYSFLKKHTVFHVSQIEGLPENINAPALPVADGNTGDAAFSLYLDNTGADIRVGGTIAAYVPSVDAITMPPLASFITPEHYKAVLLHEVVHWTGHRKRLDRTFGAPRSAEYAREELIAEMGAAFLCAKLGVTGRLQHADYIATWLKLLKGDNRAIFKAAAAAQRAVEWLDAKQTGAVPRSRALVPVSVYGSRELVPV